MCPLINLLEASGAAAVGRLSGEKNNPFIPLLHCKGRGKKKLSQRHFSSPSALDKSGKQGGNICLQRTLRDQHLYRHRKTYCLFTKLLNERGWLRTRLRGLGRSLSKTPAKLFCMRTNKRHSGCGCCVIFTQEFNNSVHSYDQNTLTSSNTETLLAVYPSH